MLDIFEYICDGSDRDSSKVFKAFSAIADISKNVKHFGAIRINGLVGGDLMIKLEEYPNALFS